MCEIVLILNDDGKRKPKKRELQSLPQSSSDKIGN